MKVLKYLAAAGFVFVTSGVSAQEEATADPSMELIDAVREGQTKDVTRLLAAGADPKTMTDGGLPLVALAAMKGHAEVVDALVKASCELSTSWALPSSSEHFTSTNWKPYRPPFWAALRKPASTDGMYSFGTAPP